MRSPNEFTEAMPPYIEYFSCAVFMLQTHSWGNSNCDDSPKRNPRALPLYKWYDAGEVAVIIATVCTRLISAALRDQSIFVCP